MVTQNHRATGRGQNAHTVVRVAHGELPVRAIQVLCPRFARILPIGKGPGKLGSDFHVVVARAVRGADCGIVGLCRLRGFLGARTAGFSSHAFQESIVILHEGNDILVKCLARPHLHSQAPGCGEPELSICSVFCGLLRTNLISQSKNWWTDCSDPTLHKMHAQLAVEPVQNGQHTARLPGLIRGRHPAVTSELQLLWGAILLGEGIQLTWARMSCRRSILRGGPGCTACSSHVRGRYGPALSPGLEQCDPSHRFAGSGSDNHLCPLAGCQGLRDFVLSLGLLMPRQACSVAQGSLSWWPPLCSPTIAWLTAACAATWPWQWASRPLAPPGASANWWKATAQPNCCVKWGTHGRGGMYKVEERGPGHQTRRVHVGLHHWTSEAPNTFSDRYPPFRGSGYSSALLAEEASWSVIPDECDGLELESSLKSKHLLHFRNPYWTELVRRKLAKPYDQPQSVFHCAGGLAPSKRDALCKIRARGRETNVLPGGAITSFNRSSSAWSPLTSAADALGRADFFTGAGASSEGAGVAGHACCTRSTAARSSELARDVGDPTIGSVLCRWTAELVHRPSSWISCCSTLVYAF